MNLPHSHNIVTVDLAALAANFRLLQKRAGKNVQLMAMVKADAYGHGMLEVAQALAVEGCCHFAVAELVEGVCLRQAGIKGQILVQLGCELSDIQFLFDYDLTPVVVSQVMLRLLSRAAVDNGLVLDVHLKVDCGMGRLGVSPHEIDEYVNLFSDLPGVRLSGVMSHFPRADDPHSNQSREQFQEFRTVCQQVQKDHDAICHIANSGGLLYFTETCGDLARPGISLYGYYPGGVQAFEQVPEDRLTPAMRLETQVVQVKAVAAGTGISYGHTFVTSRPTRIAVLPIGYSNGYLRRLAGQAQVLISGQRVPIVGRICMNLCMVDITDCPDVAIGDTVVVMGRQGDEFISADEIASWMESISYEVLCLFGNNNERRYLNRLDEKE
ncbi:MAG: alanine racemase [Desulfobulbaceae bacterium]|uniref:Alanine racemase n=1 Tax=Candidatus Desulfatifera sulfidica TaxID=2841691 RepID=A0A8J6NA72_9BACT|nr:alanine racemase [Candidatus Desulfatifera sulfidica]